MATKQNPNVKKYEAAVAEAARLKALREEMIFYASL
jgi:hypothetical protein